MFTGLIQDVGTVRGIEPQGDVTRLRIYTGYPTVSGESIAVNGVCLSVAEPLEDGFGADMMAETLRLTTLGKLQPGKEVNLERALKMGDPLGGHLVQGHVDGVARVKDVVSRPTTRDVTFTMSPALARGAIVKGSIALDGISLTITGAGEDWVSVSLIPETLKRTQAGSWQPGVNVNVETDIFVKTLLASLDAVLPEYLKRLNPNNVEGMEDGRV